MRELKRLLEELEAAEKRTDEIDALAWEDPENEELEAAWTKAYSEEWEAGENLVKKIKDFTGGEIEDKTARAIIAGRRDELKELLGIA